MAGLKYSHIKQEIIPPIRNEPTGHIALSLKSTSQCSALDKKLQRNLILKTVSFVHSEARKYFITDSLGISTIRFFNQCDTRTYTTKL